MTTALTTKVLLVEDEPDIAEAIRVNLVGEGYDVTVAGNGAEALKVALVGGFDLVILDVMLPGLDGVTFCERLRTVDTDTPILFLSALGATEDRVRGLKAGGDDYLAKPFDLRELLLRTEALLKRRERSAAPVYGRGVLRLGDSRIDLKSGEVTSPDATHRLTGKEFEILRYLAERRGQIVRRGELLDRVWGPQADPTERTVDNFVMKLRKLVETDPAHPRWIHTHRGIGYRLALTPDAPELAGGPS
jgi:two-component system alkaline phosphatase synthesis response regulator PhoP